MTSKERMDSWEGISKAEPKPSWETWKRIVRMPHINHDPKRAKEQWEKIVENHNARKQQGICLITLFLRYSTKKA